MTEEPKRKRGRPKTGFDKKENDRRRMREKRAAEKLNRERKSHDQ